MYILRIVVHMPRKIVDNPRGWGRTLSIHTVEYEESFAQPFSFGGSLDIASYGNDFYTLEIIDTRHIYVINNLNITPQAYKELNAIVFVNDSPYVGKGGKGWLNINLSDNPSIQFIDGDYIDVLVTNLDTLAHTFLVYGNGTRIRRSFDYGHAPGAYWMADDHSILVGGDVVFTDGSQNTPTSWDWDFGDGSEHSTDQNPTHTYLVAGTFYPLLKATNKYGHDFYSESIPVTVS